MLAEALLPSHPQNISVLKLGKDTLWCRQSEGSHASSKHTTLVTVAAVGASRPPLCFFLLSSSVLKSATSCFLTGTRAAPPSQTRLRSEEDYTETSQSSSLWLELTVPQHDSSVRLTVDGNSVGWYEHNSVCHTRGM
ncbi:hypothetical protein D4764_15G0006090 [Takifugu flavidus]|uniref:Uncharacterized protein n=1 Tax=Takifugu flavidus TaxID=433684 RepID=A0A5C6P0X5_9TELE|nr:hypothetical protein D4764_15G0005770 [Takifugu flavidus]TWW73204.1 hypothetical protein D4764_15G0005980 [Takifugu flavidus]TWW73215.1 hypothetical protein D4764_15G0006090 [Takifugu flavidus]